MSTSKRTRIELPHHQKPLILIDRLTKLEDYSLFIASSLDLYSHIFEVKANSYKVIYSFKNQNPVCSYWIRNQILYLGTIAGHVYRVNLADKKPSLQKIYHNTQQMRPQIVCMYQCNAKLFLINLNCQVKIIDANKGYLLQKFNLNMEVLSAIAIPSFDNKDIISFCIAFNNKMPPIIFDCQTKNDFQDTLAVVTQFYTLQEMEEQQISIMRYCEEMELIIISGDSHKNHNKSFISIYKVLKNHNQQYQLEKQYKFEMNVKISFISISENKLMISYWEGIKVINLGTREEQIKFNSSTKNIACGFYITFNQKQCIILTSRGFNPEQPTNKNKVGIHIVNHLFCLPLSSFNIKYIQEQGSMVVFIQVKQFEKVRKSAKHCSMKTFHQSSAVALSQKHTVCWHLSFLSPFCSYYSQHYIIECHASKSYYTVAKHKQRKIIFESHRVRKLITIHMEYEPKVE